MPFNILFLSLFLLSLYSVNGFTSYHFKQGRSTKFIDNILRSTLNNEVQPSFEDSLIRVLFSSLAEVLTPSKTTMDPEKLVKNPPKFIKPGSATDFKKRHKHEDGWKVQDIVDSLKSKYPIANQNRLVNILEDLEKMELLDSLDNHVTVKFQSDREISDSDIEITGFLKDTEKFVIEGVTTAFSPINHTPDKEKVVSNPRKFSKSLSLSQLRKVMKKNPDYFK